MLVDLTSRLEKTRVQSNYLANTNSPTNPLTTLHPSNLQPPNLKRIYKKRTLIPQIQQLLIRIPRPHRLLPLLIQHLTPSLVLAITSPPKHISHDDRRETHPQTHAEAYGVFGGLGCDVDVRAGDAAHVADGDQEAHADCALGGGGEVVC